MPHTPTTPGASHATVHVQPPPPGAIRPNVTNRLPIGFQWSPTHVADDTGYVGGRMAGSVGRRSFACCQHQLVMALLTRTRHSRLFLSRAQRRRRFVAAAAAAPAALAAAGRVTPAAAPPRPGAGPYASKGNGVQCVRK